MVAALAAAAQEAWAADNLASLAEHGLTLEDGTELSLGTISIAAEDLSFGLPAAAADSPEFDVLKSALSTSCILTLAMPRCRARAL